MTHYGELEIGLHRREMGEYSVELRFSQPNCEADVQPLRGASPSLHFDFDLLKGLALDPMQYGTALGQFLFGDSSVGKTLAEARSAAQAQGMPSALRKAGKEPTTALCQYPQAAGDVDAFLWASRHQRYGEQRATRKKWLEELRAGRDPFDRETLESLRIE